MKSLSRGPRPANNPEVMVTNTERNTWREGAPRGKGTKTNTTGVRDFRVVVEEGDEGRSRSV